MSGYSKYLQLTSALRGEMCELELVTKFYNGKVLLNEVTNVRRAVCKKAMRRGVTTVLTFADIDRDALDKTFPFETFTVADFPELYVEHINWFIPQGVGTVVKVPLAWVVKTGGVWKYAGPQKFPGSFYDDATLLAVYRGTQADRGAVVNPSEYFHSTLIGADTGIEVNTVNFTREQLDLSGRPYELTADWLLPAVSRTPSGELQRILEAFDIPYNTADFAAAVAHDASISNFVDCLYGSRKNGRTGNAIVEDLLGAARGWLSQTDNEEWTIIQDKAKSVSYSFNTATDEVAIANYGDGNQVKTVSLEYRPKESGLENYEGKLSRETVGASGELKLSNPYIRDHTVADMLMSYWEARINTLREAEASMHAVHMGNGERISITDEVTWGGLKDFIITGVNRPADRNNVRLREYDAAIYTYVPGTLPDDATNIYSPDYSYTAPLAPTSPAVISQGTSSDNGKVTAYALVRAVPPAYNWTKLMAMLTDTTTNEQYIQQLLLSGGNYEVRFPGLRPNRAHQLRVWAVNQNNIDGAVAGPVAFTSATDSSVPNAPSAITASQVQSFELDVAWTAVADVSAAPQTRAYVLEEKVNAGAFTAIYRGDSLSMKRGGVAHGDTYQYRVKTVDTNGNESAYRTSSTVVPQAMIYDPYIVGQGVGGSSIADSSINRDRSDTGTGSITGTVNAGFVNGIAMEFYTFFPAIGVSANLPLVAYTPESANDQGIFGIFNDTGSNETFTINYRNFEA